LADLCKHGSEPVGSAGFIDQLRNYYVFNKFDSYVKVDIAMYFGWDFD